MIVPAALVATALLLAAPGAVEQEEADLARHFIQPGQLKRLVLETPLAQAGQPRAFFAIPDDDVHRRRAALLNAALRETAGIELPVRPAVGVTDADLARANVVLLGHLENNPVLARLYHNFYDCLDTGYTGSGGYEIRSVHDPWGAGTNAIVCGGSDDAGADAAADALAALIRKSGGKDVVLPRLLVQQLREEGRYGSLRAPMSPEQAQRALADDLAVYDKPGVGRSAAHTLVKRGMAYHRFGDPSELDLYRKLMLRHIRFYAEDDYVRTGMRRYDRDFRDSWAWKVVVTWDLLEEEPIFSDADRLAITNHCLRLVQECVLYQGWDRPGRVEVWRDNKNIVHNHNTWPGLGCYFGARYFGKYYRHPWAEMWQTIADGMFNGQKLSSKPLEDAASYQWLPLRHTIIWSLAGGDHTFFEQGHARAAAENALMLTDNLGNQPSFGDHTDWTSTGGIPDLLGRCAWYYRDGRYLWGAQRAGGVLEGELLETYFPPVAPRPAENQVGVVSNRLPRQCYDYASHSPTYATKPNQPYEATFDKLTFRSGLDGGDQYLLLDGFSRGTHMHFDGNALIHFADRGACWLVDGEYIRNGPKYHNSLTVLREGESTLLPAVTSLVRQADLGRAGFTSTRIKGYNGATWTRHLLWQKGDYFVVLDEVAAERPGAFSLGSTWRVLGEPQLDGSVLTCRQRDGSLQVRNVNGIAGDLRFQRMAGEWPINSVTWRAERTLKKGETFAFRSLFYASSPDRSQSLTAAPAGARGVVVADGARRTWCGMASAAEPARLNGLETDAALFRVGPDGFALAGACRLSAGETLVSASRQVDFELDAATGRGVLVAAGPTTVALRLAPGTRVVLGQGDPLVAGADGRVKLTVPAGRHALTTDPFALPERVAQVLAGISFAQGSGAAAALAPEPKPAWVFEEFAAEGKPLTVQGVAASAPPYGRFGPVEKLVNGRYSSSLDSVMWGAGVAPVVTLDLGKEQEVESIRLRAWELSDVQKGVRYRVELSSDGFQGDVRPATGEFRPAGTEEFGNNVNTLYTLAVKARVRHLRLSFAPGNPQGQVYLAEIEVFGNEPGRRAAITAMASGALQRGGAPAVVAATAAGQIVAVDAAGRRLWEHQARGTVQALVVADLDGDGRAEVVAGGSPSWLLCLDADGERRWEHRPAAYRALPGDVVTIAVGDLEGDGELDVVAGLKCWKYIALDAAGKEKWDTIIYAHSASTCALVDADGTGKRSVLAGNVYYQLNLLAPDGKVRWQRYRFGPEHTAAAAADLNGDGKDEILAGSDLGEFHAIDGEANRLWAVNAGDAVRAILVHRPGKGAPPEVYAAGESGFVYACTAGGKPRWKTPVGDAISGAVLADVDGDGAPEIVAAAGNAGVAILRRDGTLLRRLRADAPVAHVQVLGGPAPVIVAALADGRLAAWPAP